MDNNLNNDKTCAYQAYKTQGNRPTKSAESSDWNYYAGNDDLQIETSIKAG